MLALTLRVGPHRLALDTRRIKEVVPRVPLRRVAPCPTWLAGVFVYRQRVVPVVDLHHLLGAGDCPPYLSSRIILVPYGPGEEELVGLLAAQVAEVRTLEPPAVPPTQLGGADQPNLGPILADGSQVLHLLDPDALLPAATRRQLAGLPRELPA